MIFKIFYWSAILAITHSYVLYPIILFLLSRKKIENKTIYENTTEAPNVSILMSLFNEEKVIEEKIQSILKNNYPNNKIEIIIGSDASTDKTNEIINCYTKKYPELIQFYKFDKRRGKANIINEFYEKANGEILILTDANVIFAETTIFELVRHFKNQNIGLVDSNMINNGLTKTGISIQEKTYIANEVTIKNREGIIWGTMMGPFGGCYAVRKNLYKKVPTNFLVDDFYINFKVLQQGKKTINNLNAKVFEDVSNNIADEFKRKVRISTGNFQNLQHFAHLLLGKNRALAFCFFSHKVLRWSAPLLLIIILLANIMIINEKIYLFFLTAYFSTLVIPGIDFILKRLDVHVVPFRFITHFYSMNTALLIGFFKYIKGVKTNVWQPTKRYQSK